jgi:putative nucleotidyltransferase with HDIG domain
VSRVFLVYFNYLLSSTPDFRPVRKDRAKALSMILNAPFIFSEPGVFHFTLVSFWNFWSERRAEGKIFLYAERLLRGDSMSGVPNREDAWKLLCEYTSSESLRKHMLAVEACVRAYARKFGGDENVWGVAALLHDFDYERWPNTEHAVDQGHPSEGAKILRERGYPEEIITAILSHADYTNVPRQTQLDHTLFACDELAGFLTACAYVRPSKSILDLEVDSVKRRLKDKAFAKGVSRDDVRIGAEELGIPLEEHIQFCIGALRENADALGLRGNL